MMKSIYQRISGLKSRLDKETRYSALLIQNCPSVFFSLSDRLVRFVGGGPRNESLRVERTLGGRTAARSGVSSAALRSRTRIDQMAYALRPRPCRNGCGVERQQGRVSDPTKCSRPYVRGGDKLPFEDDNFSLTDCKETSERVFAYIKVVYTHFLPLIDISEDYRRVFWVIPWAVLVAVYLLKGMPISIPLGFFFTVMELLGYPKPDKLSELYFWEPDRYGLCKLYRLDLHASLRRLLASKSLMAIPMGLLFLLDCLLYLLLVSVFWMLFAFYLGTVRLPRDILSFFFISFREGKIDDFQRTCCQCLTQRICNGMDFSFAREACVQCRRRDERWIWVRCGADGLDDKSEWRRVARDTGEVLQLSGTINLVPDLRAAHQTQQSSVQACLISDTALVALQFPIHTGITQLPRWSLQIKTLTSLDLSSCRAPGAAAAPYMNPSRHTHLPQGDDGDDDDKGSRRRRKRAPRGVRRNRPQ